MLLSFLHLLCILTDSGAVARPPCLSIAVLARVASCHKPLERALLAAKVPYVVVGGTRLCDHADVRDVLAYLQLACDPNDVVSGACLKSASLCALCWASQAFPHGSTWGQLLAWIVPTTLQL